MLAMDNKVADWQVTVEHGSDVQETGIAAGLFESTLKLVTVIFLRLVKHQSTTVQDIYQGLRNEARLYYLWGEGYSPASGYLDNILSLSVDLRATVLSLMASWARALSKIPSILSTIEWSPELPIIQSVELFAEKADLIVAAAEADDGPLKGTLSDFGSDTESMVSINDLDDVLKDLEAYRQSLMDLVPALQMPAKDTTIAEPATAVQKDELLEVNKAAHPYITNIKDRYPLAEVDFITRVGEVNYQRWKRLHHKIASAPLDESEALEEGKRTNYQPSTYASKFSEDSVFDSVPIRLFHAAGSVTSFATSERDDVNERGQRRVPYLPEDHDWNAPFTCHICGDLLHGITNRMDWKKHVFEDLEPYICSFSECELGSHTFKSRREWMRHEFSEHRIARQYHCNACSQTFDLEDAFYGHISNVHNLNLTHAQIGTIATAAVRLIQRPVEDENCPFCFTPCAQTQRGFAAHVGKHLQDVSLFALPRQDSNFNESVHKGVTSHSDDDQVDFEDEDTNSDSMRENLSPATPLLEPISGMSLGPANVNDSSLSEYACREIQNLIIDPLINEDRLKDFHYFVNGVPDRIARKEITCLRDLEKFLLEHAQLAYKSKASYISFCETTIQCLHNATQYFATSDLQPLGERPYSNSYFLDLTDKVKHFALTQDTEPVKVESDDDSIVSGSSPAKRKILQRRWSRTSSPAEMVKILDSLGTGINKEKDIPRPSLKRATSEDLDDEAMRSMARRRKSTQSTTEECKFSECGKSFKRRCDLIKHEKTHLRPWKCSNDTCKYHEYGWTTEKERDRHINDKHLAMPHTYKCQYFPCAYESKRESNCKQHMEKAHDWVYVRSKQTAKNAAMQRLESSSPQNSLAPLYTQQDEQLSAPVSGALESGEEGTDSSEADYFDEEEEGRKEGGLDEELFMRVAAGYTPAFSLIPQSPSASDTFDAKGMLENSLVDVAAGYETTNTSEPLLRVIRDENIPGEGPCWIYEDGSHCRKEIDGELVNAQPGVTKAEKPRKRLATACTACREKKIKCEPGERKCVQCDKFDRECRFQNSKDDTVGANVFCAFCGRTFVKERNRMKHEENCSSKTQKLLEKEEEVTRCICGQHYAGLPNISDYTLKVVSGDATISRSLASKDAGQLFIQCDTCRVWQHGGCVGILDETMCPKDYYCERCRDDLHEKSVTSEGRKYSRYLQAAEGEVYNDSRPTKTSPRDPGRLAQTMNRLGIKKKNDGPNFAFDVHIPFTKKRRPERTSSEIRLIDPLAQPPQPSITDESVSTTHKIPIDVSSVDSHDRRPRRLLSTSLVHREISKSRGLSLETEILEREQLRRRERSEVLESEAVRSRQTNALRRERERARRDRLERDRLEREVILSRQLEALRGERTRRNRLGMDRIRPLDRSPTSTSERAEDLETRGERHLREVLCHREEEGLRMRPITEATDKRSSVDGGRRRGTERVISDDEVRRESRRWS